MKETQQNAHWHIQCNMLSTIHNALSDQNSSKSNWSLNSKLKGYRRRADYRNYCWSASNFSSMLYFSMVSSSWKSGGGGQCGWAYLSQVWKKELAVNGGVVIPPAMGVPSRWELSWGLERRSKSTMRVRRRVSGSRRRVDEGWCCSFLRLRRVKWLDFMW